jgi:hypothetical protein
LILLGIVAAIWVAVASDHHASPFFDFDPLTRDAEV